MAARLPKQIQVGPEEFFQVVEAKLRDDLDPNHMGRVDMDAETVFIEETLPRAGQHNILLHEILHLVEEKLISAGMLEKPSPEEYITDMAGTLFLTLAYSGLWNGVNAQDVTDFYSDLVDNNFEI